jgi:predicted RNase H-like nuclease (RuvC/YqgF family)
MESKASIYSQHGENTEWTNKLNFYKDEIKILTGRLEEITSKNSSTEVLAQVEHFQNQFIIQRNNIDEALHAVKMDEEELQEEVKSNPVAVDHRSVEYHAKEKEMVDSFEKNFNDLRDEFNEFAAKWM